MWGDPLRKILSFHSSLFLRKRNSLLMCILLKVIRQKVLHDARNNQFCFILFRMSWRNEGRGWGVCAELAFPPVLFFATSRSLGKCQRLFVI